MEVASDCFVMLGNHMGLSRKEMGAAALAVAANHMMVTGVSEERAAMAMKGMYRLRSGRAALEGKEVGIDERLLVRDA